MKETPKDLVEKLRGGSPRALAKIISLIEDEAAETEECIDLLFPLTGKAQVIGVTGSPGAGKSTLVDSLAALYSAQGRRTAVLAVDPSSPFTGGALLGDRIRMSSAAALDGVFIRSMASRGALGGLAPRTAEAIFACDAAGYEVIIVETVGVGQAEVEIVKTADTVVLVLVPGMGDSVQALKAGIIEIADVFVINKADYQGADLLKRDLVQVMSLGPKPSRTPKILKTVASKAEGLETLFEEIEAHRAWASSSGEAEKRRNLFLRRALENQLMRSFLATSIGSESGKALVDAALKELVSRKKGPAAAAKEILAALGVLP